MTTNLIINNRNKSSYLVNNNNANHRNTNHNFLRHLNNNILHRQNITDPSSLLILPSNAQLSICPNIPHISHNPKLAQVASSNSNHQHFLNQYAPAAINSDCLAFNYYQQKLRKINKIKSSNQPGVVIPIVLASSSLSSSSPSSSSSSLPNSHKPQLRNNSKQIPVYSLLADSSLSVSSNSIQSNTSKKSKFDNKMNFEGNKSNKNINNNNNHNKNQVNSIGSSLESSEERDCKKIDEKINYTFNHNLATNERIMINSSHNIHHHHQHNDIHNNINNENSYDYDSQYKSSDCKNTKSNIVIIKIDGNKNKNKPIISTQSSSSISNGCTSKESPKLDRKPETSSYLSIISLQSSPIQTNSTKLRSSESTTLCAKDSLENLSSTPSSSPNTTPKMYSSTKSLLLQGNTSTHCGNLNQARINSFLAPKVVVHASQISPAATTHSHRCQPNVSLSHAGNSNLSASYSLLNTNPNIKVSIKPSLPVSVSTTSKLTIYFQQTNKKQN